MLLYKYFPPSRDSILAELLIRFTQPTEFNDPFDCLPSVVSSPEAIQEVIRRTAAELDITPQQRQEIIRNYTPNHARLQDTVIASMKKYLSSSTTGVGVLSLCANGMSVVMSSHYACRHTGFLLAFDSHDSFFAHHAHEPPEVGELRPVNYTIHRPKFAVPYRSETIDILFTKNDEWSYERESRILRLLRDAAKTTGDQCHLFKIPPSAIRQVIFAIDCQPHTIRALREAASSADELAHVAFFQGRLSQDQFKFEHDPV